MSGSRAPGLPAQISGKVTSLLCPSTPIGDQGAPDGARVPMVAGEVLTRDRQGYPYGRA